MKLGLLLLPLLLSLLMVGSPAAGSSNAKHAPTDDQFGIKFGSSGIPSNTQGLQVQYSASTTGVALSCPNGGGTIAPVDTVRTNGGSPKEWMLQGSVTLVCSGSGSGTVWTTGYEFFANNNSYYGKTISTYSTSSYPTISGTIKIYYTGSGWRLEIYVSQTGTTDSYNYPGAQGTKLDQSAPDKWAAVETDADQTGISISSTFNWHIERPSFYISGTWQYYNVQGSTYTELITYELFAPLAQGNTVGVY